MENKNYLQIHKFYVLVFTLMLSFFLFGEEILPSPEINFIEEGLVKTEDFLKDGQQKSAEILFEKIISKISRRYSRIKIEYSQNGLTLKNYPYYLYLFIDYFEDKGDRMKAIEICRKITQYYQKSHFPKTTLLLAPSAQIKLGDLLNDPQESIKEYEKALKKYPDEKAYFNQLETYLVEPRVLTRIGYIYEETFKEYDKAIKIYRDVVEKYPGYFEKEWGYPAATAQLRIVRIYRRHLCDPKKAIKEAKKLLNMEEHTYIDTTEPRENDVGLSRAEALCRIGEIYQETKEHVSATKYFKKPFIPIRMNGSGIFYLSLLRHME